MYLFSTLRVNCISCLSLRTWNGLVMFKRVYSLRYFGRGAPNYTLKLVKAFVVRTPISTRARPPSTLAPPSLSCVSPSLAVLVLG
jgi:hypothetical protein